MAVSALFAVVLTAAAAGETASVDETRDATSQGAATPTNEFDLSGARVSANKIVRGMERDGVRAVDEPTFADPAAARRWVAPDTVVLGIRVGGKSRAYPEHLLDFHQVVNDEIAGTPVAVVWDPIAGIPLAFDRSLGKRTLDFGVSGLLYQSHCLLYDRQTKSLWLPIQGLAISGPLAGTRLTRIPLRKEPMAAWVEDHPETGVLERPLLKQIDYRFSPFSAYWASPEIPYPVDELDSRFHPKEIVLGVEYPGGSRAYLGSNLTSAGGRVVDEVDGKRVRVSYDPETATFRHELPDGFEATEAYWFVWKAFHPDTTVWQGAVPLVRPSP